MGSQSLEQVALNSALRVVWATDRGHRRGVGGGRDGLRSLNEKDNSSQYQGLVIASLVTMGMKRGLCPGIEPALSRQ